MPDEEEPEGEEQERESDFSVDISERVDFEDDGQEQSCVPVSGSFGSYYKIVGDNIDKNVR